MPGSPLGVLVNVCTSAYVKAVPISVCPVSVKVILPVVVLAKVAAVILLNVKPAVPPTVFVPTVTPSAAVLTLYLPLLSSVASLIAVKTVVPS